MTLIIILLIAGFILVGAEVLLPGGILGVIALVLIIAATIIATNTYGGGAGMLVLFAGGLGSLTTFFAMFKFIAVSPSGGGLRLDSAITGNASGETIDPALIGQSGVATTKLVPNGLVTIGDNDMQAHSEDGYVDIGESVTIQDIRNGDLIVRKTV